MGGDISRLTAAFIVEGKVTDECPQTIPFEEKSELQRIQN